MRPLVVTAEVVESIKSLVKYAEENPFTMDDLLDTYNKQLPPPGDNEAFVRIIPIGYRVVFSIEDQMGVKIRHLSVSVGKDNELPNPHIVQEIMNLIGFQNNLVDCMIQNETISTDRVAVNVLEIIE